MTYIPTNEDSKHYHKVKAKLKVHNYTLFERMQLRLCLCECRYYGRPKNSADQREKEAGLREKKAHAVGRESKRGEAQESKTQVLDNISKPNSDLPQAQPKSNSESTQNSIRIRFGTAQQAHNKKAITFTYEVRLGCS